MLKYFYLKYSSSVGGSKSKKYEVVFLYRQVCALLRSALTLYIFATGLSPTFKFFLKSMNLKLFNTSPNAHSTDIRTALIDLLKSFCCCVNGAPLSLKGACKYLLRGYAGSP